MTRLNNEDLETLGHCVHACVDELAQVRAHLRNRLNRDLLIILRNHFCTLFVLQPSSNPGSLNDSVEREGDNVVDKDDGLEDAEHPVPDEPHLTASDRLLSAHFSRLQVLDPSAARHLTLTRQHGESAARQRKLSAVFL